MRALNRTDGRDLLVLLATLVVMTVMLRALVWHLVHYEVDIQTGMLLSSLGLLLILRHRRQIGRLVMAPVRRVVRTRARASGSVS